CTPAVRPFFHLSPGDERMDSNKEAPDAALEARRRFLATCGKFAIATPPAVSLILSQTRSSYATASSGGGGGGGGGWGGGGQGHKGKSGRGHSGGFSGGHSGGRGRGRGRGHS